jgi:hypothetical protein
MNSKSFKRSTQPRQSPAPNGASSPARSSFATPSNRARPSLFSSEAPSSSSTAPSSKSLAPAARAAISFKYNPLDRRNDRISLGSSCHNRAQMSRRWCVALVLALLVASQLGGSEIQHRKAIPPSAKDLVGVGIGFDSDQLTFTRLDLRTDLTGYCARVSPADTILHDPNSFRRDPARHHDATSL